VTQWGIEMSLDEESGWAPLVFQNGGEYWNADYTQPNFTDPKVIEAWQFLADLINKHHVTPSPAQSQKFGGSPFQAGQAAMARLGSYMLTPLQQNIKSFKWDVTVPPKGKQPGVFVDGIGWSINANSKVQDAAWELVKYFLTDGQTFMGQQHWQVPLYKKAFDAWGKAPPDHVAELKDQFNYGHPWPSYKNGTQVDDIIGQVTTQIWDGKITPQQGAEQIQQKVAPLVK
jgi:multiple sugar transport system substrate-binding protein